MSPEFRVSQGRQSPALLFQTPDIHFLAFATGSQMFGVTYSCEMLPNPVFTSFILNIFRQHY